MTSEKPRAEKVAVVDEVAGKLEGSTAVFVTEYRGLRVGQLAGLRRALRPAGGEYKVYKNTLVKLAIAGTPMEKMGTYLEGPTAVIFSWDSPSAAAKVAREFAKNNEKLKIKGGYLEGNVLDPKGVVASADLPGKDEIRAALLATLAAPATNLVRTLNAAAQNFAYVLDARKRALEAQG